MSLFALTCLALLTDSANAALTNTSQILTALNNPYFATSQADLVGVNFYYSNSAGSDFTATDIPAGTVNGVAFDNIDMWNGSTGTAPASGPYALSANGAGPSLTITAPFTWHNSRKQESSIAGTDAANLSAVADVFFYMGSRDGRGSVTLAFTSLGVAEDDALYVQLIGGDSGWTGSIKVSANESSIGSWT